MSGLDLVPMVTSAQRYGWEETTWEPGRGYGKQGQAKHHVVAIDYGVKRNILRLLARAGCKVTVVPATASAEDVLALEPDGVFLSNGPGDPAATGEYAVPVIRSLLDRRVPTFGICLGHQMLGLAVGGRTVKMRQGHHGANHPVKDKTTGKVEITSMNHGFAVDPEPAGHGGRDARLSVRRLKLRHRAYRPAGVLGPVPSGSIAWAERQPLPFRSLRAADRGREVQAGDVTPTAASVRGTRQAPGLAGRSGTPRGPRSNAFEVARLPQITLTNH